MSIFAELPNGTRLEFPDGTDPAVMDRVVRQNLGVGGPAPVAAQPEPSLDEGRLGLGPGFSRGIVAAVKQLGPTTGAGIEAFGISTGVPGIERAGTRVREMTESETPAPDLVKLRDFFQKPFTFIGEQIGSGLGSTLPSLAAGAAGAGLGALTGPAAPIAVPAAIIAGAGGTALLQNTGDLFQQLQEEGIDRARAARVANIWGVVLTVPDVFSASRLLKPFLGTAVTDLSTKSIARAIATRMKEGAKVDAITEFGQNVGQEAIAAIETGNPDLINRGERVATGAIAGGLTGGVTGAGGAVVERLRKPADDTPPPPPGTAPPGTAPPETRPPAPPPEGTPPVGTVLGLAEGDSAPFRAQVDGYSQDGRFVFLRDEDGERITVAAAELPTLMQEAPPPSGRPGDPTAVPTPPPDDTPPVGEDEARFYDQFEEDSIPPAPPRPEPPGPQLDLGDPARADAMLAGAQRQKVAVENAVKTGALTPEDGARRIRVLDDVIRDAESQLARVAGSRPRPDAASVAAARNQTDSDKMGDLGRNTPPGLFAATTEWQEVPADAILPAGLEIRMDTSTGKNFARRPPPTEQEMAAARDLEDRQRTGALGQRAGAPRPVEPPDEASIDAARKVAAREEMERMQAPPPRAAAKPAPERKVKRPQTFMEFMAEVGLKEGDPEINDLGEVDSIRSWHKPERKIVYVDYVTKSGEKKKRRVSVAAGNSFRKQIIREDGLTVQQFLARAEREGFIGRGLGNRAQGAEEVGGEARQQYSDVSVDDARAAVDEELIAKRPVVRARDREAQADLLSQQAAVADESEFAARYGQGVEGQTRRRAELLGVETWDTADLADLQEQIAERLAIMEVDTVEQALAVAAAADVPALSQEGYANDFDLGDDFAQEGPAPAERLVAGVQAVPEEPGAPVGSEDGADAERPAAPVGEQDRRVETPGRARYREIEAEVRRENPGMPDEAVQEEVLDRMAEPAQPAVEATPQGDQFLAPGIAPVSDRERAEVKAAKPLKSDAKQKDADEGLFDVGGRGQQDLEGEAPPNPKNSLLADLGLVQRDATDAEIQAARKELVQRLRKLGVSDRVMLIVERNITGQTDKGYRTLGQYTDSLIRVAMGGDMTQVLNHEIIHALRDLGLLTRAEWNILQKAATADAARMRRIARDYSHLDADGQIEEAVADMFADWAAGRTKPLGPIAAILERIKGILEAIGLYYRARDYSPVTDRRAAKIFSRIESGAVGERKTKRDRHFTKDEVLVAGTNKLADNLNQAGITDAQLRASTSHTRPAAAASVGPLRPMYRLGDAWTYVVQATAVAARDRAFARVLGAVQGQDRTETYLIKDGGEKLDSVLRLNDKQAKVFNQIAEYLTLSGKPPKRVGKTLVLRTEPVSLTDDVKQPDGSIRQVKREITPENYKPGDILEADAATTKAIYDTLDYGQERWMALQGSRAQQDGYTGEFTRAGIDKALADAKRPQEKLRAEIANAMFEAAEEGKRKAYFPLMRYGDTAIVIKPKPGTAANKSGGVPSVKEGRVEFVQSEGILSGLLSGTATGRGRVQKRMEELKKRFPPDQYTMEPNYLQTAKDVEALDLPMIDRLMTATNLRDAKQAAEAYKNALNLNTPEYEKALKELARALPGAARKQALDKMKAGLMRERDTVPGYETDFRRALMDYNRSSAGIIARRIYRVPLEEAKVSVFGGVDEDGKKVSAQSHPSVRKFAERYLDYIDSPEHAAWRTMRWYGFYLNIFGSFSSAAVNGISTATITAPQIAAWSPAGAAGVVPAFRRTLRGLSWSPQGFTIDRDKIPGMSPDEAAAVKQAALEGTLDPSLTLEFQGTDVGSAIPGGPALNKTLRKYSDIGSSLFNVVEQINRYTAFIAAYRAAQNPAARKRFERQYAKNERVQDIKRTEGLTPATIARFMVEQTQFIGGQLDRPSVLRGAGGVLLQFKTFPVNYTRILVENLTRQGPQGKFAAGLMMLGLFSFAGLLGLPFAQDALDIVEIANKAIGGLDEDIEGAIRKFIADIYAGKQKEGESDEAYQKRREHALVAAEVWMRGPSREFLGINLGQRLGVGEVGPEIGDIVRAVPLLAGTIGRVQEAQRRRASGQDVGAAVAIASPFVGKGAADAARGLIQYPAEGYRTQRGTGPVIHPEDITFGEKALKAIGFQPARWARTTEKAFAESRKLYGDASVRTNRIAELGYLYSQAIKAQEVGDDKKAERLLDRMAERLDGFAQEHAEGRGPAPPKADSIRSRAMENLDPERRIRRGPKERREDALAVPYVNPR